MADMVTGWKRGPDLPFGVVTVWCGHCLVWSLSGVVTVWCILKQVILLPQHLPLIRPQSFEGWKIKRGGPS